MSSDTAIGPKNREISPDWRPVSLYPIPEERLPSLGDIDKTLTSLAPDVGDGADALPSGVLDRLADAAARAVSLAADLSERAAGAVGSAVSRVGNSAVGYVTRAEGLVDEHDGIQRQIRENKAATNLTVGADGGYVIPVVTREPTDEAIESSDGSDFRELPVGDRLSRLHWSVGDAGRRTVGYIKWFAERVQPGADGALSELYGIDPESIPPVPEDVIDTLRMLDDLYGVGFVDVRRIPQSVQTIIMNLGDYTRRLQDAEGVHAALVRFQLDKFLRLEELTVEVDEQQQRIIDLALEEVETLAALEPGSDEQVPDGIGHDEPSTAVEQQRYWDCLGEVRDELCSLLPLAAKRRAEQLRITRWLEAINERLATTGKIINDTLLPDLEKFYVDMDRALGEHGRSVDAFHASLRNAIDGAGALEGGRGELPPAAAGTLLALMPEKDLAGKHVI